MGIYTEGWNLTLRCLEKPLQVSLLLAISCKLACRRREREASCKWPSSTNRTRYNDKHMKWLIKPLEKMLSSCFTQPVTLCSALATSASFPIHPPVEPNKREKQKSKIFLSLYPVLLVLEGQLPAGA